MEWFIQIQRKILEWEWYSDINTFKLFLHLLLTANYKESKWRWETINPWQILTWRKQLAQQTWLSEQQVRTVLDKLESTWEITSKITNKYSILTLNNWASYNQQDNKRITNNQPTSNQQVTTSNKYNNINKDNKDTVVATQPNEYQESILYLKKQTLENIDLPEFAENYKNDWIAFIAYWTEKGRTWKLRAEWEKTFEIRRRWATWMSRKKETYQAQQPKQKPVNDDPLLRF